MRMNKTQSLLDSVRALVQSLTSLKYPGGKRDHAGNPFSFLTSQRDSVRPTLELDCPGSQCDGGSDTCPTLETQRSHWFPALGVL